MLFLEKRGIFLISNWVILGQSFSNCAAMNFNIQHANRGLRSLRRGLFFLVSLSIMSNVIFFISPEVVFTYSNLKTSLRSHRFYYDLKSLRIKKKVYFLFMTVAAGSNNKKPKLFSTHSRHGTLCLQCSVCDFDSSKCREVWLQFSHFYKSKVHHITFLWQKIAFLIEHTELFSIHECRINNRTMCYKCKGKVVSTLPAWAARVGNIWTSPLKQVLYFVSASLL